MGNKKQSDTLAMAGRRSKWPSVQTLHLNDPIRPVTTITQGTDINTMSTDLITIINDLMNDYDTFLRIPLTGARQVFPRLRDVLDELNVFFTETLAQTRKGIHTQKVIHENLLSRAGRLSPDEQEKWDSYNDFYRRVYIPNLSNVFFWLTGWMVFVLVPELDPLLHPRPVQALQARLRYYKGHTVDEISKYLRRMADKMHGYVRGLEPIMDRLTIPIQRPRQSQRQAQGGGHPQPQPQAQGGGQSRPRRQNRSSRSQGRAGQTFRSFLDDKTRGMLGDIRK